MVKSERGFTIVELLIVIVVIAILAAITIVAYVGIQNRAKNAQILGAFDAYEKVLRNINTIDGSYPDAATISCLGDAKSYPATSHLAAGECYNVTTSGVTTTVAAMNSTLNQRILKEMTALPNAQYNEYTFTLGGSVYWARGILYNKVSILFILSDPSQQCGRGTKGTDASGLTICTVNF